MKKIFNKDNFFMKTKTFKNLICFFGIILFALGVVIIALSFCDEILDDKYIIKNATEYKSTNNNKLSKGEMKVSKIIDYKGNGIYKIKYNNYAKESSKGSLVSEGTYFSITDILGKSYELASDKVIINDKEYKLNNDTNLSENGINITYSNNIINIELSEESLLRKNVIEISIKLIDRQTNFKYQTSQESYFSFVPSKDNEFYKKKSAQSYIIKGNAYIELDNK